MNLTKLQNDTIELIGAHAPARYIEVNVGAPCYNPLTERLIVPSRTLASLTRRHLVDTRGGHLTLTTFGRIARNTA